MCRDKVAYILKNQNTEARWNDCQDAKKRYTRGPWVHPDARRESMATTLRPAFDHSSSLIHMRVRMRVRVDAPAYTDAAHAC